MRELSMLFVHTTNSDGHPITLPNECAAGLRLLPPHLRDRVSRSGTSLQVPCDSVTIGSSSARLADLAATYRDTFAQTFA
jgi:hypothetical protein